jgi:hypothetical protein
MLALPISPADLSALLTGNVPAFPAAARARAGCGSDGKCIVDLGYDDLRLRVFFAPGALAGDRVVEGAELRRGNSLVFRSDFVRPVGASAAEIPRRIVIENPDEKVRLIVDYEEAETVSVEDALFAFPPGEDTTR